MARKARPRRVRLERDTKIGNQYRWAPRLARLLGKISDAALAARAGVGLTTVIAERRRRGIAPCFPPGRAFDWTLDAESLLGEMSDPELAATLGITTHQVAYRRRNLGIPPWNESYRSVEDPFWTPRRVALLGSARDKDVGRRLGISGATAAYQRRRRQIPPFAPRAARVVWTVAMARQLGKLSDTALAHRFGIDERTVRVERHRRGIAGLKADSWKVVRKPELRKLLRMQTNEVVRLTGLNEKTVRRLRADLGMAQPGIPSRWTPAALRALGRIYDEGLARRLGLKVNTVRLKRNQMGIRRRVTRRWTAEEDALVRRLPLADAARATGRTPKAVRHRRASRT